MGSDETYEGVSNVARVGFNLVESHPEYRSQESEYSIDSQHVMHNLAVFYGIARTGT